MNELDAAARELIQRVGHADDPTDADRERLRRALAASLGTAAMMTAALPGAAATGAAATGAAATGAAAKLSSVLPLVAWFGAGLAGGVGVAVVAHSTPNEPLAGPAPAVAMAPAERSNVVRHSVPSESGENAPARETLRPAASASSRGRALGLPAYSKQDTLDPLRESVPDSTSIASFPEPSPSALSEELRLLELAQKARAAARCDEALRLLAEHTRRFPAGTLDMERRATRVHCLCELGRDAEARDAFDALLAAEPSSPHVLPLLASCAGHDRAKGRSRIP